MEAAYYDNIIEQQRIEPEFFRMGFYGRKFPFFLRVSRPPDLCRPATATAYLNLQLLGLTALQLTGTPMFLVKSFLK